MDPNWQPRIKRNVAALSLLERESIYSHTPATPVSGWSFFKRTHPIDGHEMALGYGPYSVPMGQARFPYVNLFLSATRTGADAASIETTLGLDLRFSRTSSSNDDPVHADIAWDQLRGPEGMFPNYETAAYTKDTSRVRVKWNGLTTAPDIVLYRGVATLAKEDEVVMSLIREFPANYDEPPGEQDEHTLTKTRTTAFDSGSSLALSIPYLSLEHELIYSVLIGDFIAARDAVVAAVTPTPPPSED